MKKIKLILLMMITLLIITLTGNAQNWQWAKHVGGNLSDGAGGIMKDGSGNIYVGYDSESFLCHFQTDSFPVNGYNDLFLVKYNSSGTEQWIKQFGGNNTSTNPEGISGSCFDATTSYIYITGTFSGSAVFGSTTLVTSGQGLFLAKLDLNGNCIWAVQNTGGTKVKSFGVAADIGGNVYITGINTTPTMLGIMSLPAGGFIAKFDNSGNCIWARREFRQNALSATSCEVYPSDIKIFNSNIVVVGSTTNDTIVVDTITALNSGNNSALVSSFNLSGDVQWLKLGGGPNAAATKGFGMDGNGNIYVQGYYTNTATFESTIITNTSATADAFLAKYDINGNFKWVQKVNASAYALGQYACSTIDGNTYFTGCFSGTANFGTYSLTSSTTQDMFVVRYDSTGNCLGVIYFGKAIGYGVYADDNNSFYVGGTFLGNVSIGINNFTDFGSGDAFFAKSDAITGINTNHTMSSSNQLLIYANPNKGTCTITVPDDLMQEQNLSLSIYSNEGKLIQQTPVQINQEKVKINLEEEAKGIYNVTLGNSKKMYSGKIIFE